MGRARRMGLAKVLASEILRTGRSPRTFIRAWARFPVYYLGLRAVENTPAISVTDIIPNMAEVALPPIGTLKRTEYNARLDEQIYIGYLISALRARRIFEIGTFDGDTTRYMAEVASPEAHVWTIDLPPEYFTEGGLQGWFTANDVGRAFHDAPEATRITQLRGDSTAYDYGSYWGTMDLVSVDAAHDYTHGLADSRTALRLVHPDGIVLWHDFTPQWGRLVHAIREATRGYDLRRIGGTSLVLQR